MLLMAIVAASGAIERGCEVGQKKQSEFGLKVVAEDAVQIEDGCRAKLTACALVGLCGVGVAVAEDDLACCQGRQDDLMDRLCTVSEHECHLGHGRDGAGVALCT